MKHLQLNRWMTTTQDECPFYLPILLRSLQFHLQMNKEPVRYIVNTRD